MNRQSQKSYTNEYIRSFIRELIFITPPGGRLPGIRQLMQTSGVGRIRLEKILQEFADSRVIEIRPQSGCYRTADISGNIPMAFIHFSPRPMVETEHAFHGGAVKYLREKAAEKGQTLEIIHACGMSDETLCEFVKSRRMTRAFILSAYNSDTVVKLQQHIPYTVSLLPRYPSAAGSELRDSPAMTAMQLEYLFNRNYRNIAYIHNAEDHLKTPVQLMRLFDYYRIMAEHGIKVEPEWVFFYSYDKERFFRSMHRFIGCKRPADALIVPGSCLKLFYEFCADNGLCVGKDLAVMCCDNVEPDLIPRATTVTNSPREIGEMAWLVMQRTLQGETVSAQTNLKIITGETVPYLNISDTLRKTDC